MLEYYLPQAALFEPQQPLCRAYFELYENLGIWCKSSRYLWLKSTNVRCKISSLRGEYKLRTCCACQRTDFVYVSYVRQILVERHWPEIFVNNLDKYYSTIVSHL